MKCVLKVPREVLYIFPVLPFLETGYGKLIVFFLMQIPIYRNIQECPYGNGVAANFELLPTDPFNT